jgi:predicted trehalose synthase
VTTAPRRDLSPPPAPTDPPAPPPTQDIATTAPPGPPATAEPPGEPAPPDPPTPVEIEAAGAPAAPVTASDDALARWLTTRRWFARSADGSGAPAVDLARVPLGTAPALSVGIATTGTARYQLLLPGPATTATAPAGRTARSAADAPPDVAADPEAADALARFVASSGRSAPAEGVGTVAGRWLPGATPLGDDPARALSVEQSNSSVVVGGTHVLKLFRRLQAGPHPEVEIGRHLAAQGPDLPVARLDGWYDLTPDGGDDDGDGATALGVVQVLVPGALDGWGLVLSALAGDPDGLLGRLHDLGAALAHLHDALARPGVDVAAGTDPGAPEAFGAVPFDRDHIESVVGSLAAGADRALAHTADLPALVGRAADVGALARSLADAVGPHGGAAIRHHGDLHLGQTVVGADGWVVLDFEGEPNRPLAERRRRHSPLRDVAGMLRSFAYAVATHHRADGRHLGRGWEPAARAAFLDGYLAAVDPALLPPSATTTRRLLDLLELEKVVYEIGYELAHRPDWVSLPADGLRRLLDEAGGRAS